MKTSIVILTHNQLAITQLCIESIRKYTSLPYEIIVTDNGSTDETVGWLQEQDDIRTLFNQENLGFAKGCNQGLKIADGDYILFLNNDTIVTTGWLEAMLRTLESDPKIGMVGPVTNYVSGRQLIQVNYTEIDQLEQFAAQHAAAYRGMSYESERLVGFCLCVKRSVIEEVNGFDERFGLGNYEDDDLCLRIRRRGYTLHIVQDSFIHHFGHMTMKILQDSNLTELLAVNRVKAAEKWGDDIFNLIYRQPAPVTLIMILEHNSTPEDLAAIEGLRAVADEIIIWNKSTNVEHLVEAKRIADRVVQSFEETRIYSSKEFLLLLSSSEHINDDGLRLLDGLKRTIGNHIEGVRMTIVSNEAGAEAATDRFRMVRRERLLGWDPASKQLIPFNAGAALHSGIVVHVN
ncbi:glycosyltransferase [Paenibacillaceae bacterium]|nr:glycosyltransferase [Paenibacillaceae bacterium]